MKTKKNLEHIIFDEDGIDFLRIIGVLFRYRWFILIFTGSVCAVTFLFLLITRLLPEEHNVFPDYYQAQASVMVTGRLTSDMLDTVLFPSLNKSTMNTMLGTPFSYGELTRQLLDSRDVIEPIVNEVFPRPKGAKENRNDPDFKAIQHGLIVTYDERTMLLNFHYTHYNAEIAQTIVNRAIELLNKKLISLSGNRSLILKGLLDAKLSDVNDKISVIETDILEFQRQYGVLDIDTLAGEQINLMAKYRSELIMKELEIETYGEFSRINDPVAQRLKAERGNLLKLIQKMESGFKEYKDILTSQKELPKIFLEYHHLKKNLAVQEKIYEILMQQYELIKLSMEGEEPLLQIVEWADKPKIKIGPNRLLLLLYITAAAFAISIFLAFFHRSLEHILQDPERLKKLRGEG